MSRIKFLIDKSNWIFPIAIHGHSECLKELHEYRSKVGKAIDEIKEASFKHYFENGEYIGEDTQQWEIVKLDRVLEILKRNIGE